MHHFRLAFVLFIFFWIIFLKSMMAQTPVMNYCEGGIDTSDNSHFGLEKIIPGEIRSQVLLALKYYPELKNVKIIFRFANRKTPLTSRPQILSLLKRKSNRAYVITISKKTDILFSPIQFSALPFNAQVGVLGHELAHIADYASKSKWQLFKLGMKMRNAEFTNTFEFNTDYTCIQHGLGYQLLSWSVFVRDALGVKEWKGTSTRNQQNGARDGEQRYMNPETIEMCIDSMAIYRANVVVQD